MRQQAENYMMALLKEYELKNITKNINMTAVEWLAKELESYGDPQVCEINWEILDAFINKAKQIEKEQHQKTFQQSRQATDDGMPPVWESWEQYYNETYGK